MFPLLKFSFRMTAEAGNDEKETLGDIWVILNTTMLIVSAILCFLGYGFIFNVMRGDKVRGMVKTEQCWGISLGVSDLMAATLTIPIFLSGLIIQRDFLPWWLCYIAGFIDNLYLAASIWSIVMWSVCRYIFIRNPLSLNHLKITKILIFCVWISASLLALFPLVFSIPYKFSTYSLTCSSASLHYNLALGLLTIVLSLSVITVIFSLTFRITARMDRAKKITFHAMCDELPVPSLPNKCRGAPRSLRLVETDHLTPKRTVPVFSRSNTEEDDELICTDTANPVEGVGDRFFMKSWSQTSTILEEIEQANMVSPKQWHTECSREKESPKAFDCSSAETVFSDMISPVFIKSQQFRWTPMPPVTTKRPGMTKMFNQQNNDKKERKKALTGSRRTLVVLTCLFITQVMSLLPIFLLFVLVHFSKEEKWVPSQKMIILMTTLMVCNTGFNPIIRIVIKPSYNAMFVMKITDIWAVIRRVTFNGNNYSDRFV